MNYTLKYLPFLLFKVIVRTRIQIIFQLTKKRYFGLGSKLAILFCLIGLHIFAQKKPTLTTPPTGIDSLNELPRIVLVARNYGDSVVLRWTPNRAAYWLNGLRRGYTVQRIEVSQTNPKGIITNLTPQGIKPLPLEEMKRRYRPNDKYVAIAAQLLYGKNNVSKPFSGEMGDIISRSDEQNQQFMTGVMAADYSVNAAMAMGVRIVDKSPKKAESIYMYQVWMNYPTPLPANALRDTASVAVFPQEKNMPFAPFIDGIISGDGAIMLRWLNLSANGEFSGFFIERSEDGVNFHRLNNAPYVYTLPPEDIARKDTISYKNVRDIKGVSLYTDSVKINYKKFYYRIIGVDVFGDLSPASDIMVESGRDLTPPSVPKNVKVQVKDNKVAILTWEKYKNDADLRGYVITRSGNVNGPFQALSKEILPPNSLTYTDPKPLPYIGHYYVIGAVDTAGNVSYALPVMANIEDRIPPSLPKGLFAKTDTSGKIRLTWSRNSEPDVVAYKVYRSYARENRAYNQLTNSAYLDTTYVDSLPLHKMLNREVFYKIVAIDLSSNHSAFSEILKVILPDKIPPSPPVAKDIIVNEKGIQIEFIPSSSTDVVEHIIYRKDEKKDWKVVKNLSFQLTKNYTFIDSILTDQGYYEYAMVAKDESGLLSEKSFSVPIKYVAPKTRKTVEKLTIAYERSNKNIVLHWDFAQAGEYHFVIYRSINGEGLMQFHAVESNIRKYADHDIKSGNTYEYALKVFNSSGSTSKLSQIVSLKVE